MKECHQPKMNEKKMVDQILTRKNGSQNRQSLVRVNANKTKQMQDNCPLADGTIRIWNFPVFKNRNVTNRYAAPRKQRLCYG